MKFQNCILINFELMHRRMYRRTSNTPLQHFQSWGGGGHKNKGVIVLKTLYIDFTDAQGELTQ